jgi:hypothetical protein
MRPQRRYEPRLGSRWVNNLSLPSAFFRADPRINWGKLCSVPAVLQEPSIDYRRLARRLRCQLGNDPISKQHALAALARRADRSRRPPEPDPLPISAELATPYTVPAADNGVRAFAAAVSSSLEGPILRFSRRQQLIRQAERLGIRRFDANLLIAAVQHRLESEKASKVAEPKRNRSAWRFAPIGFAIGVQAVILLGVWGLLHS